jgi:hypothetical protein
LLFRDVSLVSKLEVFKHVNQRKIALQEAKV